MITVNGEQYELIPQEPKKKSSGSSHLVEMFAFMSGFAPGMIGGRTRPKQLPTNDIVGEYELILQKNLNFHALKEIR